MFKNYLLLARRHLLKNRGYSAINIAGLSIGMAIALVIGLWIKDEATFDHYAPDHSRLAGGCSTCDSTTPRKNRNSTLAKPSWCRWVRPITRNTKISFPTWPCHMAPATAFSTTAAKPSPAPVL